MRARVVVMLREGVLDPQGEAVRRALGANGFTGVASVRQGKVIELDLAPGTGRDEVARMCEVLLANTVIERYEIEMEGGTGAGEGAAGAASPGTDGAG